MQNNSNNLNSFDTPALISVCVLLQFEGDIAYVLIDNTGRSFQNLAEYVYMMVCLQRLQCTFHCMYTSMNTYTCASTYGFKHVASKTSTSATGYASCSSYHSRTL